MLIDGYEQSRAFNTSRIRLIQVLGNSHPKSNTELITQYCEVKLIALTPQDRSIPFVGLYSKGIHMHPPVWSEKVPLEIRDELDQLLKWAGSNNYTFSEYLQVLATPYEYSLSNRPASEQPTCKGMVEQMER